MPLNRNSIDSCLLRMLPLAGAILLAGCASFGTPPRSAWRILDSDAPLGAQDHHQTLRLPEASPNSSPPQAVRPAPTNPPGSSSERRETARALPEPLKSPLPRLPRIEPEEVTADTGLELLVDAPARKQVGSHATYRVTVRNLSELAASDVTVLCQFDDPLVFSGSDKRSVAQRFEKLLPGEAKELALSLYSAKVGSHCCRFSAAAGDENASSGKNRAPTDRASKSVCVEFVSRQLQIDMVGPSQRTEGSRAEFTFTLTNHSTQTLTGVQATLAYDKALVPREASAGKETRPGSLSWQLGTLLPMESIQLQVDFECRAVARRACVRLEVLSEQISSELDEACLEIGPIPGTLDLQISDRDDPIESGKAGRYEITVHNIGLQAARQILLEATIPEQLKVIAVKVLNGDEELPVTSKQEGQRLIFDPVDDLAADARLTFVIDVEAVASGTAWLRAQLSSSLGSTPVTSSEPTVIAEP